MENERADAVERNVTGTDVLQPQEKKGAGAGHSKPKKKSGGADSVQAQKSVSAEGIYKTLFAKLRVPVCFAAILLVSVAAIACLVSEVYGSISPVTIAPVVRAGDSINAVSFLVIMITGMAEGMLPFDMFISIMLTISVFASLAISVTALVFGIRALLPGQEKLSGKLLKIAVYNIAVNALVMTFISMAASVSPYAANNMLGYAPSPILIGAVIASSALVLYIMITDIVNRGKFKDKEFVFGFIMLCVKLALAVLVLCVISTTEVLTVASLAIVNTEFFAYVFAVLLLLAAGAAADAVVFYTFKLANFDTAAKKERTKEFILGFVSVGLMFLVFCFGIAYGHVADFPNTLAVNLVSNSVIVMILSGIGLGVLLFEKISGSAKTESQSIIAENDAAE